MATPYGTTCPILNIAKAFGEDYGDCLRVADWMIHKRAAPHPIWTGDHAISKALWDALSEWADEFNRIRRGVC